MIDIAKGISIILVAYGHSELSKIYTNFSDATMLLRMPLFFFLSGVFFSLSSKPTYYILHKTDALLKPYFATLFLLVITTILFGNAHKAWQEFIGIFYGNGTTIRWGPLWFLTHLWSLFVASYFILGYTKLSDKSNFMKISFIIFLFVIGSFTVDIFWYKPISMFGNEFKLPGLPFSIDIIFLSMAFFLSGYFLNQKVKTFKPSLNVLLLAIFIFIAIFLNSNALIHFYSRKYHDPIYATLAAFSGIYIVLSLSYYISKNKIITTILTTFGSASLFILIFHAAIQIKVYMLLSNLLDLQIFNAVVAFLVCVIVPLLIKYLIQKSDFLMLFYFPLKSNKLFQRIYNKFKSVKQR